MIQSAIVRYSVRSVFIISVCCLPYTPSALAAPSSHAYTKAKTNAHQGAHTPTSTASAQNNQQPENQKIETRRVPALSVTIHRLIARANEAVENDDISLAKETLTTAIERSRLNDYERAVIWQIRANIAFTENDTPATIAAYEQMLTYRQSIPVAQELQVLYYLAQLHYSADNTETALAYISEWEPRSQNTVDVQHLSFIATLHYVQGNHEEAITYIDRTITQASDTAEIKENWYNIKLASHWELRNIPAVRDTLETMVIHWPKPNYWTQLAGAYQELGDDEASYSLVEASYLMGYLDDKPEQLINMAQIQLAREAPIKCTWVFDRAFRNGRIEKDTKTLKSLGQCYLAAAEYSKAVSPLTAAAQASMDPDLWFQVGQITSSLDLPLEAVSAYENAIELYKTQPAKKAKRNLFRTLLAKGRVLIEEQDFVNASHAFDESAKIGKSRNQQRTLSQLRAYLNAEKVREETLRG
ncbi:MAG: hypothetical protein COB37_06620 [Kordiimonadales bacterium]|nr:MAG: hypothetical protein COB37_06620 [Kordiimonadales bacterium]